MSFAKKMYRVKLIPRLIIDGDDDSSHKSDAYANSNYFKFFFY